MVDIMNLVMRELQSRGALDYELYAPYYVCSYAMHAFNLMNQERKIYWEYKSIPNMRIHIIFVAPPGGMKTFFLMNMGGGENAVFQNTNYAMNLKSNISEATLVGTYTNIKGSPVERQGEARIHSKEFLLEDEFDALVSAMTSSYNSQLRTQLLHALDHGNLVKDMTGGPTIQYKTYFTMWGGVQPQKYDIADGLGRRLCFLLNMPNKSSKKLLGKARWGAMNLRGDEDVADEPLPISFNKWTDSFSKIEHIDWDNAIEDYYIEKDIGSEMYSLYNQLILGWHLARGNVGPDIKLDIKDPILYELLENERIWRRKVELGPDLIQIGDLIDKNGYHETDDHIYISVQKLNSLAPVISMSIARIHNKLDEMRKYGMISNAGKGMICYEPPLGIN
jgi:hypothetical protein